MSELEELRAQLEIEHQERMERAKEELHEFLASYVRHHVRDGESIVINEFLSTYHHAIEDYEIPRKQLKKFVIKSLQDLGCTVYSIGSDFVAPVLTCKTSLKTPLCIHKLFCFVVDCILSAFFAAVSFIVVGSVTGHLVLSAITSFVISVLVVECISCLHFQHSSLKNFWGLISLPFCKVKALPSSQVSISTRESSPKSTPRKSQVSDELWNAVKKLGGYVETVDRRFNVFVGELRSSLDSFRKNVETYDVRDSSDVVKVVSVYLPQILELIEGYSRLINLPPSKEIESAKNESMDALKEFLERVKKVNASIVDIKLVDESGCLAKALKNKMNLDA